MERREISKIFHTHTHPNCRVVLLLNMIDITTVNDQGKMKYLLIKQGYRFVVCLQRQ